MSIMNARNLLFHLAPRIHWRADLRRGKGAVLDFLGYGNGYEEMAPRKLAIWKS